VDSFFWHENLTDDNQSFIICPDSYFKLIIFLVDGEIKMHFLTGLWAKEKEVTLSSKSVTFGIRFKILAPEYVFNRNVATILNDREMLDSKFWGIHIAPLHSFEEAVKFFEARISAEVEKLNVPVDQKKMDLSRLLDNSNGQLKVKEIEQRVKWSDRQMGRYLNKHLGVSLKRYLNIQKVYAAYIQIRNGEFFPNNGFYDQAHFIREIKKHTGETPTTLHGNLDDRFIQLKNIERN
jgi:AraC-like DNA-binding protein